MPISSKDIFALADSLEAGRTGTNQNNSWVDVSLILIIIGIFVFIAFTLIYNKTESRPEIYYGRKWSAWVFAFLPLIGQTGENPALTGDWGGYFGIISALAIVLLPISFAAGWIRGRSISQNNSIRADTNTQPSRDSTDGVQVNHSEGNLSLSNRMMKKGAVGQTAKACANVFKKIKSESTHKELHKVLRATLDFRYAAAPTESNLVRHKHINQWLRNQISSEADTGVKDLVVAILDQEMDINGIESSVEDVVIVVLREEGISGSETYGRAPESTSRAAPSMICDHDKKVITKVESDAALSISVFNEKEPVVFTEDELYERAWEETDDNNNRDNAIWGKAFALYDGDLEKIKAHYIKERVKSLHQLQLQSLEDYKERKKNFEVEVENEKRNMQKEQMRKEAEEKQKKLQQEEAGKRHLKEEKKPHLQKKVDNKELELEINKLISETEPGDEKRIVGALSLLEGIGVTDINHVVAGETLLIRAARLGDKNTALLLVLAGVRNRTLFSNARSASDIARSYRHNDLAELIEEHSSYLLEKKALDRKENNNFLWGLIFAIIIIGMLVVVAKVTNNKVIVTNPPSDNKFTENGSYTEKSNTTVNKSEQIEKESRLTTPDPENFSAAELLAKGDKYFLGEGIDQDYKEAVKWYREAAEQGYAAAQNNLGDMYRNGWGVEKDFKLAVKWYLKSAGKGNATAINGLTVLMSAGVEKDLKLAVKLFRMAAAQGNATAINGLGVLYSAGKGVDQDYKESVKWYRMAAEQGYAAAQNNLGVMYESGFGVDQDYKESVKWYRMAAEQGYAEGQKNLGEMYRSGWGVDQDDKEAVKLFRVAAEQGNAVAQRSLDDMAKLSFNEWYETPEKCRTSKYNPKPDFVSCVNLRMKARWQYIEDFKR